MPLPLPIQLDPALFSSATETVIVPPLKVKKRLKPSSKLEASAVVTLGAMQRDRSIKLPNLEVTSTVKVKLKQMVRLSAAPISSETEASIKFFINNAPIAPPSGSLSLASVQSVSSITPANSLNGQRLIKGDTIPLYFLVEGQRLGSLTAEFKAVQKFPPGMTGSPVSIVKSSNFALTSPVLNQATNIEVVDGNFSLNPADTDGFPDAEIELAYQFKLSDGMGRSYTVEHGHFTVFPVL